MRIPTLDLAYKIVDTLDEKKGEDILLLDLTQVCTFTDYFVICTGASERTLNALAEDVHTKMKSIIDPELTHKEGDAPSGWILIDYGNIILHLFKKEVRGYYRLEELWRDGQILLRMP